jgi:FRG domain
MAHDEDIRRNREKVALATFFHNLDDIGYSIPGDSPALREAVVAVSQSWPDDELFPFLAFAQHYGIPTRLLDWSQSARTAAYFAAIDALNCNVLDGNIVVWALSRVFIELNHLDPPEVEVRIVRAARASNPNLHAQQGLFTLCRRNDRLLPLEQIVSGILTGTIRTRATIVEYPPRKLVMQKLTLPQTEAWRLLELLKYENVTGATLFPSPEGAIKRMVEPNHWRTRPPIYPLYSDEDFD